MASLLKHPFVFGSGFFPSKTPETADLLVCLSPVACCVFPDAAVFLIRFRWITCDQVRFLVWGDMLLRAALPCDYGSSPRRVPVKHLLALVAFMLRSTAAAKPPSSAGVHERETERKKEHAL